MEGARACIEDKDPCREIAATEGLSTRRELCDSGCYLIENAGFADISLDARDFDEGRSFVFLNNNTMKFAIRARMSPMATKHTLRPGVDFSIVRGFLTSFKNSSSSSAESEMDGYCAFPVDEEIFDPTTSNRTSILSDADSGSASMSLPNTPKSTRHSISRLQARLGQQAAATAMSTPSLIAMSGDTQLGTKECRAPILRTRAASAATCKSPEKRRSYYVPGDEISPDAVFESHPPMRDDPMIDFCPPGYSLPDVQPSEMWGEVGPEGGILQLPGSGISFHLFPSVISDNTGIFKAKSKEDLDSESPEIHRRSEKSIDRRVVIGLEDAPDIVNSETQIAVGSMVCVDYGDTEVVLPGAVLQVDINATLKEPEEGAQGGVECEFACLIANTSAGIFEEVEGECYQYGNTLQVAILPKDITKITDPAVPGGSLRLVPIVKICEKSETTPTSSVWDGIASLVVWAAVYGPKRAQWFSTCCVSLSTSTTCPPTLSIKRNNKGILLHLWTAYRVGLREPQHIRVLLQPGTTQSTASTFPSETFIAEREIRRKSRVNKLFTLKYAKDERSSPKDDDVFLKDEEPVRPKRNERFLLSLVGLKTGVLMEMRFIAPVRSPSWSTPVKRWKKNVFSAPPRTSSTDGSDRRGHNYLYLWHDAQREAAAKLRPRFEIPGSQRQICISQLAVAVTSRVRGKRQKGSARLLAEYEQSDIMPILSNDTLWAHGSSKYKEWYVGYSRGKVGLIHTQCVRNFKTDRCYTKGNSKITVGQLIENIVDPVGSLCFSFNALRDKLLSNVRDWALFSSVLRFGENYIARVVKEMNDNSKREMDDKLSLFLEKFKEYCLAGPQKRSAVKDIIRALLYMEEYDLVADLISDFCVLSVSVKAGRSWEELKSCFQALGTKNQLSIRTRALRGRRRILSSTSEVADEDAWVPAFDWLSSLRKEYTGKDRAFLVRLHKAVDAMSDSPNRTWTTFTGALVLLFCIDSLIKNEKIL